MPARFMRSALAGAAIAAFFPLAAHAELSPQRVGEILAAAVEATEQATLTFGAGEETVPGVYRLSDIRIADADGSGPEITIPAITVTGAEERPEGGMTIETLSFDGGTAKARGTTATWTTAAMSNVIIPSPEEVTARLPLRVFERMTVEKSQISGGRISQPIDVGSAEILISDAAGGPGEFTLNASAVRIPAAMLSESAAGAVIAMLRYDEFLADVEVRSVYDPATDEGTLETFRIDVPSVGAITLAGRASGFSIADITSPDEETAKAARANAKLAHFSFRLDNAGFVERMLDMQADMLGGTRDDVRNALVGGALPFALSFIKNEEFRKEFQTEIGTFLAEPKSLTITANPPEPVPLGQALRSALRAPATIPDLLAPTVSANQ